MEAAAKNADECKEGIWATPKACNYKPCDVLGSSGFVDAVRIETLNHTNGVHVRSELNQTLVQGADNEEVEALWGRLVLMDQYKYSVAIGSSSVPPVLTHFSA